VCFRPAKWPGPTRPCAPLAPTPPHAPLLSLSHLDLPRNNLHLPLPPLSPRGALGIGDGDHRNLDPKVSSPPLPFSSLSPSPSSSSSPAHALPLPGPRRRPPPPPRPTAARGTRPLLARRGPSAARPRRSALPGPGAAPAPGAASAPCARRPGPWRGSRGLGVASRFPVYR
jgi:hypothetical protein